jgi:cytochrome bd-type quinol oxidase subunit 2
MAQFFQWFVLLHILGLVIFAVCHGVSMFVAFRIRPMRDPRPIAAALEASSAAVGPMYLGLLLLIVGGLGAAAGGDLWTQPWIIASAIVLVAVLAVMYMVATPYYRRVREAVGASVQGKPVGGSTASVDELAALLDTRRPEILMVVGGGGLVILLWLMVLRPTL